MMLYPQYETIYKKEVLNREKTYVKYETLKLGENYNLRNPEEIIKFIGENPNFIDYFKEITPIVKVYYPIETCNLEYFYDYEYIEEEQIALEIEVNPESDDTYEIEKWLDFAKKIRKYELKYGLIEKFLTGVI